MDTRPDPIRRDRDLGDGVPSIIVAVNGRTSGWQALDWAAAECAASGSPLRIVRVINDTLLMLDPHGGTAGSWLAAAPEHGARVLDEAARRARGVAPQLVISTCLEVGHTAVGLRRAGGEDEVIVVGRGRTTRLGRRSTGWRIAYRARGPVAIVELDDEQRIGPSAGRVVLGINETAGPLPAVVYSFDAASRRGVGLTVIHAYAPRSGSTRRSQRGRFVDDLRKLAAIDDVLQAYEGSFPDVNVRRRFVPGAAAPALVAESEAAALLVIGARSSSRLQPTRLGSVSRAALRWARRPVAVIPPPRPARLAPVTDGRDRGSGLSSLGTATDA